MHPRRLAIAIAAVAVLCALPREAFAFRCGSRLVHEGDSAVEVIAKCGEPTGVSRRMILRPPIIWRNGRPYRVPGEVIEAVVEIWTYNLGPNRLMRQLRIEDGRVVEIRTLGYGYR